jgi:hypothetical protein
MVTAFVGTHCCLKGVFLFVHRFMDVLPLAGVSVCFPVVFDVPFPPFPDPSVPLLVCLTYGPQRVRFLRNTETFEDLLSAVL